MYTCPAAAKPTHPQSPHTLHQSHDCGLLKLGISPFLATEEETLKTIYTGKASIFPALKFPF
jgi:hypothetical protein